MSARKRQSRRLRRRIEVRFAEAGKRQRIGYSGNISNSGMMIRTPVVVLPGRILNIELRIARRSIALTARVVWARPGPMSWLSTGRIGIGVRFIDPPANLVDSLRDEVAVQAGADLSTRDRAVT